MKTSTLSATIALLASTVLAAPASTQASARQFQAQLTFTGADASQSYSMSVPTTADSTFEISESPAPFQDASNPTIVYHVLPFHRLPRTRVPDANINISVWYECLQNQLGGWCELRDLWCLW